MLKGMEAAELDDATLMARVAQGDRGAFRVVTARLHPPALRLASRLLTNRGDAEDALQHALIRLWQNASRYEATKGSLAGWFRRIVVNTCLDVRRSLRVVAPIEAAADAPSPEPGPHDAAERVERAERVNAAVARLNPRQRAAIALFYGEGATMVEIASMLETTPKAVEGLLARARVELARDLAERPEE